jgi:hypothetical protein
MSALSKVASAFFRLSSLTSALCKLACGRDMYSAPGATLTVAVAGLSRRKACSPMSTAGPDAMVRATERALGKQRTEANAADQDVSKTEKRSRRERCIYPVRECDGPEDGHEQRPRPEEPDNFRRIPKGRKVRMRNDGLPVWVQGGLFSQTLRVGRGHGTHEYDHNETRRRLHLPLWSISHCG